MSIEWSHVTVSLGKVFRLHHVVFVAQGCARKNTPLHIQREVMEERQLLWSRKEETVS